MALSVTRGTNCTLKQSNCIILARNCGPCNFHAIREQLRAIPHNCAQLRADSAQRNSDWNSVKAVIKAATASTPVMEITESDGNWSMKTSTSMKSMELKFK